MFVMESMQLTTTSKQFLQAYLLIPLQYVWSGSQLAQMNSEFVAMLSDVSEVQVLSSDEKKENQQLGNRK